MPPTLGDRLSDILKNIERIGITLKDVDRAALAADWGKVMILERAFEIICEASRHIPPETRQRTSNIDWRRMNDLGNRLRHAYTNIDIGILLQIVEADLPPLKTFVERILAEEAKR